MLVRAAFHPSGNADTPAGKNGSTARGLTLFVPTGSLFEQSQESARVWSVERGRARLRILTLGSEKREGHIQVIEGLKPGDQVILPPFDRLKENQRIKSASST